MARNQFVNLQHMNDNIKPHLVVLSGAGISAESGIQTFRDSGGLWEGHKVEDVATPEAFDRNPELVLDFYNLRRETCLKAKPNNAHLALRALEDKYKVSIITQNVDDLHERAGSSVVLHLHGELLKARSTKDPSLIYTIERELLNIGDTCELGSQLRPHIVWFGEAVPMIEKAAEICQQADLFLIIGTSLQVYPAAGLVKYVNTNVPVYIIDPKPVSIYTSHKINHIPNGASKGMEALLKLI
jgi:NAD-dependent deacetylase